MTPPVRKQSKKISIDAGGGAILNERIPGGFRQ
ncbi:hypothetical protein VL22_0220100 [Escherichia fergusonii]|nr:hypothetical protein VL22_0220100 [Escherichia fergusonii]